MKSKGLEEAEHFFQRKEVWFSGFVCEGMFVGDGKGVH